ncbi:hypothetical protein [Comamonas testosteroni]|uniref:hypothetical protein n=1 Tax=Comamonas testosteroni TaxID=285 RepID=UPI000B182377|nr:hypothetical protein [Comamonas testosteroni]
MEQLVLKHQLPSSALLYSKIAELLAFSIMSSASRWSKSRFGFPLDSLHCRELIRA